MSLDALDLGSSRLDKLRELFFLFSNPLQPLSAFKALEASPEANTFFQNNDISSGGAFLIASLPGVEDYDSLKRLLLEKVNAAALEEPVDLPRSRPESTVEEPRPVKAQKTHMTDYPSRLMPAGSADVKKKPSSAYLKSQIEVLEEEMNSFLNKDVSDLNILSLPEHYPTVVHNVSSLAELYYLTQTLPLIKLLPGSHKTLMSENFELALLEGKIAVLYSRIEELKRQKKWSLRQPIRYYDPFLYSRRNKKSKSYHWDTLLEEGKWMAADFKESAKFKKACCVEMAQAVQDYWTYGTIMCVKRKPIVHLSEYPEEYFDTAPTVPKLESIPDEDAMEVDEAPNAEADSAMVEDAKEDTIAESETKDAVDQPNVADVVAQVPEEPTIDVSKLLETNEADEIVPQQIPELTEEELEAQRIKSQPRGPFKLHANISDLKKIDQSIIRNLPKFTAFDDDLVAQQQPPLKPGETSLVPVSRMLFPMEQDDNWYKVVLRNSKQLQGQTPERNGPPEYQKGLFGVQSHRRFNFLKPPKPPLLKNIEYRLPTIWLPQDDKYLIHYVAEYCFNWDLIAENLSSNSSTLKRYESNIERRTPWQCFERYIQLNEKFQFSDMKGVNAYLAQKWLEHAHKAQLTTKRRISPLGVGNESIQRGHRRLRWASMFDAIRKTMRKRETAIAKVNHRRSTNNQGADMSSSTSPTFGNNTTTNFDANGGAKRPADRIPTPAELSKLKHGRDKSIQEAYMHQQATRNRMLAAISQLKLANPAGAALSAGAGGSTDPLSTSGSSAGRSAPGTSGLPLQHPTLQSGQNLQGLLQLQQQQQGKLFLGNIKRPTTPGGTPYSVEQIQLMIQAQKQKRMMQQQNQTSKGGVVPATTNLSTQLLGTAGRKLTGTAQMHMGQQNFSPTTGTSATAGAPAASQVKRPGVPAKGRLQFQPAQVSAIINSIQQKNPNLSKEQVTKLAATYLANIQQQQQNRLEQQQLDRTGGSSSSQQNLKARQAQLNRQRSGGAGEVQGKEMDLLSKLQYEERKKLMMQQSGLQFSQSGAPSPNYSGNANASSGQMSPQGSLSYPSNASSRSSSLTRREL